MHITQNNNMVAFLPAAAMLHQVMTNRSPEWCLFESKAAEMKAITSLDPFTPCLFVEANNRQEVFSYQEFIYENRKRRKVLLLRAKGTSMNCSRCWHSGSRLPVCSTVKLVYNPHGAGKPGGWVLSVGAVRRRRGKEKPTTIKNRIQNFRRFLEISCLPVHGRMS